MTYCANCTCPKCTARRVPPATIGQLEAYAASLLPYHRLSWSPLLDGGCINAWLGNKPLVGNRTVAQVREMVVAMGVVAVMPA